MLNIATSFGFPLLFALPREKLLDVLYLGFKDRSKIYVGKDVKSVHHSENGQIKVFTRDGDAYEGDLVVGADGVHSTIRSEISRLSSPEAKASTGKANGCMFFSSSSPISIFVVILVPDLQSALTIEFCCLFGISSLIPGFEIDNAACPGSGVAILVFKWKNKLLLWFVIKRMDTVYDYSNAPRFDESDIACVVGEVQSTVVSNKITFGDIWKHKQRYSMVAMEEGVFQTWNSERMVCIGDSVLKVRFTTKPFYFPVKCEHPRLPFSPFRKRREERPSLY